MAESGSTFQSYVSLSQRQSLISFDKEEIGTTSTNANVAGTQNEVKYVVGKDQEKLCGFLNKYKVGARGLKNFKRRWFVYGESTCTLLYYRTPVDIVPLGEIDIKNASFSLEVEDLDDREHVFEIRCNDTQYQLEALDHRTMMFWLLALQKRRRQYSKRRTATETGQLVQKSDHGLIHREHLSSNEHSEVPRFFDSIECPSDTVGDPSVSPSNRSLNDISISNWKTELRNVMANMKAGNRTGNENNSQQDAGHVAEPPVGELVHFSQESQGSPASVALDEPQKPQESKEFKWSQFTRRFSRPKSFSVPPSSASPKTSPTSPSCARCKEMEFALASQKEETEAVEEELLAHRELVKILQRQIEIKHKETVAREEVESVGGVDHLLTLSDGTGKESVQLGIDAEKQLASMTERDRRIIELEHLLAATQEEKELFKDKIRSLENEVANLKEQLEVYFESLSSKDKTVVELTNRMFELEQELHQQGSRKDNSTNTVIRPIFDPKETERLRDIVEGYKLQNQFLNKEIIELTHLRADDEIREKALFMKSKDMEARFYQAESKYLFCLEQLRRPQRDEGKKEVVSFQRFSEIRRGIRHRRVGSTRSRRSAQYGSHSGGDSGNLSTLAALPRPASMGAMEQYGTGADVAKDGAVPYKETKKWPDLAENNDRMENSRNKVKRSRILYNGSQKLIMNNRKTCEENKQITKFGPNNRISVDDRLMFAMKDMEHQFHLNSDECNRLDDVSTEDILDCSDNLVRSLTEGVEIKCWHKEVKYDSIHANIGNPRIPDSSSDELKTPLESSNEDIFYSAEENLLEHSSSGEGVSPEEDTCEPTSSPRVRGRVQARGNHTSDTSSEDSQKELLSRSEMLCPDIICTPEYQRRIISPRLKPNCQSDGDSSSGDSPSWPRRNKPQQPSLENYNLKGDSSTSITPELKRRNELQHYLEEINWRGTTSGKQVDSNTDGRCSDGWDSAVAVTCSGLHGARVLDDGPVYDTSQHVFDKLCKHVEINSNSAAAASWAQKAGELNADLVGPLSDQLHAHVKPHVETCAAHTKLQASLLETHCTASRQSYNSAKKSASIEMVMNDRELSSDNLNCVVIKDDQCDISEDLEKCLLTACGQVSGGSASITATGEGNNGAIGAAMKARICVRPATDYSSRMHTYCLQHQEKHLESRFNKNDLITNTDPHTECSQSADREARMLNHNVLYGQDVTSVDQANEVTPLLSEDQRYSEGTERRKLDTIDNKVFLEKNIGTRCSAANNCGDTYDKNHQVDSYGQPFLISDVNCRSQDAILYSSNIQPESSGDSETEESTPLLHSERDSHNKVVAQPEGCTDHPRGLNQGICGTGVGCHLQGHIGDNHFHNVQHAIKTGSSQDLHKDQAEEAGNAACTESTLSKARHRSHSVSNDSIHGQFMKRNNMDVLLDQLIQAEEITHQALGDKVSSQCGVNLTHHAAAPKVALQCGVDEETLIVTVIGSDNEEEGVNQVKIETLESNPAAGMHTETHPIRDLVRTTVAGQELDICKLADEYLQTKAQFSLLPARSTAVPSSKGRAKRERLINGSKDQRSRSTGNILVKNVRGSSPRPSGKKQRRWSHTASHRGQDTNLPRASDHRHTGGAGLTTSLKEQPPQDTNLPRASDHRHTGGVSLTTSLKEQPPQEHVLRTSCHNEIMSNIEQNEAKCQTCPAQTGKEGDVNRRVLDWSLSTDSGYEDTQAEQTVLEKSTGKRDHHLEDSNITVEQQRHNENQYYSKTTGQREQAYSGSRNERRRSSGLRSSESIHPDGNPSSEEEEDPDGNPSSEEDELSFVDAVSQAFRTTFNLDTRNSVQKPVDHQCNKGRGQRPLSLIITEPGDNINPKKSSVYTTDDIPEKSNPFLRRNNNLFSSLRKLVSAPRGQVGKNPFMQSYSADNFFKIRSSVASASPPKTDDKKGGSIQHPLRPLFRRFNTFSGLGSTSNYTGNTTNPVGPNPVLPVIDRQERDATKFGGEEGQDQEVVSQLLEEAIASDVQNRVTDTNHGPSKFDKYGFRMVSLRGEQDLLPRATSLQRKSEELKTKDVDREVSLSVKWENLLQGIQRVRDIRQSVELKNLIRCGVPTQHKEAVWNLCVNSRVEAQRRQLGAQYYYSLLEQVNKSTISNPAVKQIELDLLRTLPRNRHYEELQSEGIPKLRRVLLAYTQHNPDIGYCQGVNRLAAIALLFLTEEDAFWCLVAIMDYIMPVDYYSPTLMAAQTDQRVLKDLVAEKLPRLNAHLEHNQLDISLFTFNWFLTIFVDNIPIETFLRIWDAFLYEGSKVLFRYAIAFLKYREEEILQQPDVLGLHRYLRALGENMTNVEQITQIAFHDINPFSMRHINAKRQAHTLQVKAELAELEAIRNEFRSSTRQRMRDQNECFSDDDV